MTDETTPDAVEARDPLDGLEQLRRIIDKQPEPAPESVMLGLDYCYAEWVAERARHAEEVAEARRQKELWRQETASLQGAVRKLMDQLEAEEARVTSLRSLLPDVRVCAEHCISCSRSGEATTDATGRILAALDSQGGEEPSLPGEPTNGNAGPARKDKSCSK